MKYTLFIENLLRKIDYEPIIANTLEETIFKTIVGTLRTIRLGPIPTVETRNEILYRISEKIKENRQLEITSAWGAIKTIPVVNRGVDFTEFLTLKQFHAISKAVKKVYPPGIRFNIYLGDSYYSYLYGNDYRIDDYCKGMKVLSKEYDEINLIRLSELCGNVKCCEKQCSSNYELLKNYWFETMNIPQELYTSTESYLKLKDAGWVGIITPAMREFYFKRMTKLYPDETVDYRIDKIIKFFAYGLMISQNDLMGRKKTETCTIDACLLRVPPPDLPRKLYSNRLRMRIVPTAVSKLSAPPWTIISALCENVQNDLQIKFLDINSENITGVEIIEYNNVPISIYKADV